MHRKRPTLGRRGQHRAAIDGEGPESPHNHLQFFPATFRRQIEDLAGRATCFADLALSFPGLLFALATGYGTVEKRRAATACIAGGARLREAADALGLPWWMRRLPPQAFSEPLARIPDDQSFSTRIVNLLPNASAEPGLWLQRVLRAYRGCNAEFALWVARHDRFHAPLAIDPALPYLAAWAWHAWRPDTLAGRLLRRRWTPSLSPRRASDELTIWRKRLRLAVTLEALQREPWLTPSETLGYDFVELRTIDDFISESEAMDNCLDSFADRLESSASYVFSIRRRGHPVADLEIGSHPQHPQFPAILQLLGPRNRRVSPAIWRAAYTWLGSQSLRPPPAVHIDAAERRRAWKALWRPYLSRLEASDRVAFERILVGMDRIRERRGRLRRLRTTATARLA